MTKHSSCLFMNATVESLLFMGHLFWIAINTYFDSFLGHLLNNLFNNQWKSVLEFLIMKISKVVCPLIHYQLSQSQTISGMPSYLMYINSN